MSRRTTERCAAKANITNSIYLIWRKIMNQINIYSRQRWLYFPLILGAIMTMAQTSEDYTYALICVVFFLLPLLIIIGLRVYTSRAGEYTNDLETSLPVNEVLVRVDQIFPERTSSFRLRWQKKRDKVDPNKVLLSTFIIPDIGGCLIVLLTGIIPGLILYYLVLGRTVSP
jgi:hypothetical protein